MDILHDFRKDTFLNDLYRGRAEADRIELGAKKALEKARRGEEEARRGEEVARRGEEEARRGEEEARRTAEVATLRATAEREAKDAALAETERLRSLLLAAGILLPDVS